MAHNSNLTSEEREIEQLRKKIDKFARDIINCLANHVRRNVSFSAIIKSIIKICFQYSSQSYSLNYKTVKHRYCEKRGHLIVFLLEEEIN